VPLLPFDTFSLETPLAPGEVRARLAAAVEPKRRLRLGGGRCPFEGEVEGDSFRVSRVINYRNSFLPHVRGRVVPAAAGSRIEGSMALHPAVLAFIAVWCGLVLLIGVGVWGAMLADGRWRPGALVPLGMLAFLWALSAGAFTVEARRARAMLGQIVAPAGPRHDVTTPAT